VETHPQNRGYGAALNGPFIGKQGMDFYTTGMLNDPRIGQLVETLNQT
jgi:hypothetical protein